jgi:hypothetical protein
MLGLKNLRGNTEADVAGLLDAAVDVDVAVVDDEEEEAGRHVVAVTSLVPNLLDWMVSVCVQVNERSSLTHLSTVGQVAGSHPWLLAVLRMSHERSTVALIDLHELGEESLNRLRRGRWDNFSS